MVKKIKKIEKKMNLLFTDLNIFFINWRYLMRKFIFPKLIISAKYIKWFYLKLCPIFVPVGQPIDSSLYFLSFSGYQNFKKFENLYEFLQIWHFLKNPIKIIQLLSTGILLAIEYSDENIINI